MMDGTLPILAPGEVLATVLIFTLSLIIALFVALRMGLGFRFLERGLSAGRATVEGWQGHAKPSQRDDLQVSRVQLPDNERSRATVISDAIRNGERREVRPADMGDGRSANRRIEVADRKPSESRPVPLGQSYRRSVKQRSSKSISQRNGQT